MLEANRLSNTDPLTELNNRRSMENVINAECVRQRRYGGCFSVVVLDLDGFKGLNDTKGHHVGDQALIRAAMLLRTRTRKADTVARFGGDEFAIVMPNTDAASGEVLCQHVCRDMGVTLTEEFSMPLSASIGVVTVEKPDMRVEDILASADKAMYRAKESGKGCVVQGELVRVSDDGEEMALEARP
jgi:diguanylate cyclase (GGDEF)-like protein